MDAGEADHVLDGHAGSQGDIDPFQEAIGGPQPIAVMHRYRQHPGNRAGEGHQTASSRVHRCALGNVKVDAVVAWSQLGGEPSSNRSVDGANKGGAAQRRHEKNGWEDAAESSSGKGLREPLRDVGDATRHGIVDAVTRYQLRHDAP